MAPKWQLISADVKQIDSDISQRVGKGYEYIL